jgi:Beta-propeller repeat
MFDRPIREPARLIGVVLTLSGLSATVQSQPIPASMTTVSQPTSGSAIFDQSGNTYYLNGPVTPGAAQTQPGGGTCTIEAYPAGAIPEPCPDAGIVKVDPAGNVVYGTLLGGPTADSGSALAVDSAGGVFITGSTGGQFPTTTNAAIPTSTRSRTFAARLSPDGSAFLYSTYLPDTAATATAIAIDIQDNAYITGQSTTGVPYVIKLSPDGSAIQYNVFLAYLSEVHHPALRYTGALATIQSADRGANLASGAGNAVTIDPVGNAIVVGSTSSPDFPVTPGALQPKLAGSQNIFVVKLDPAGEITYATYVGGSGADTPSAVQTDSAGNIYVAGATNSLDFPTTPAAFEPTPVIPSWSQGYPGGFAFKLAASGSALLWSTYVMSENNGLTTEIGVGEMAVSPSGDVYLGGLTGPGFPVTPSAPEGLLLWRHGGLPLASQFTGISRGRYLSHREPPPCRWSEFRLGTGRRSRWLRVGGVACFR